MTCFLTLCPCTPFLVFPLICGDKSQEALMGHYLSGTEDRWFITIIRIKLSFMRIDDKPCNVLVPCSKKKKSET